MTTIIILIRSLCIHLLCVFGVFGWHHVRSSSHQVLVEPWRKKNKFNIVFMIKKDSNDDYHDVDDGMELTYY